MSNANCVFVGNLTRDVEVKSLNNGGSVANLGLAVNESYVDKNGEKKQNTTFLNLEAWSYTAQNCSNLTKGQKVIVVASPRMITREEGGRAEVVFRVEEIGVVPRSDKSANGPAKTTGTKKTTTTKVVETVGANEEIPF